LRAIKLVGDANAGQWIDYENPEFVHVRRRLTEKEQAEIGPVVDIRGTREEATRLEKIDRIMRAMGYMPIRAPR
jgi:hypothetical protein